ncbi:hypothetical protein [Youngiibacter multivorans]|uniref:Uncharacterized protein n=1 Tax=Youngiibacter multivorans TaxID=937251 RepID=A0ABS4G8S3_9CLOT|nr:hypothetical protein [Youngiibacter multivorans]MBP1920965.1 hypothetical protein [Youngiibacter multivorans]
MISSTDEIERYQELTDEDKETVIRWIEDNLIQSKTFNQAYTSYGLKHYMENDTGIYVCNGAFKGCMMMMGYEPKDIRTQNHIYKISSKSPGVRLR